MKVKLTQALAFIGTVGDIVEFTKEKAEEYKGCYEILKNAKEEIKEEVARIKKERETPRHDKSVKKTDIITS